MSCEHEDLLCQFLAESISTLFTPWIGAWSGMEHGLDTLIQRQVNVLLRIGYWNFKLTESLAESNWLLQYQIQSFGGPNQTLSFFSRTPYLSFDGNYLTMPMELSVTGGASDSSSSEICRPVPVMDTNTVMEKFADTHLLYVFSSDVLSRFLSTNFQAGKPLIKIILECNHLFGVQVSEIRLLQDLASVRVGLLPYIPFVSRLTMAKKDRIARKFYLRKW